MSIEAFPDTFTEASPDTASIDFVFCNHSEDNLHRVANAIIESDGDIIAIEKIREGSFAMGTAEEKRILSDRITNFIATDSAISESAREYFATEDPFFTHLLDSLKGSGKRVELIDIGTDDPHYYLYQDAREAIQAYTSKVAEGRPESNIEEWEPDCSALYLDYQIASARESEYREHKMEAQLSALAIAHPGQKITVMAGAMHTPMSYGLSHSHKVTRIFVPTEEASALHASGEKMHFSHSAAQTRFLRLHLDELGLSTLDTNGTLTAA